MPGDLLIRDVELDGRAGRDVRIEGGRIVEIGAGLAGSGPVLEGDGGALIPGLCDHHIHVLGLAARVASVSLDGVIGATAFKARITEALALREAGAWVRVLGYHESMAGELSRAALDEIAPRHRLRVQHQTGSLWVLNSLAIEALGAADGAPATFERKAGRLWRGDAWLRSRIGGAPPLLAPIGEQLAGFGITALTDASVTTEAGGAAILAQAHRTGELPQRLHLMSGGPLEAPGDDAVSVGPVKVLLDDHALPDFDDFTGRIAAARTWDRAVAVHCVTAGELALTLAAFEAAGARPGDRIEHGGVIAPAAIPQLRALGLTVVTQPAFIEERGDRYARDIDPGEHDDLYRLASLIGAGVPVAGSSDAPYATPDPWRAIRAATTRRTRSGRVLGPQEAVDPATALSIYLSVPQSPGRRPRRVAVGTAADLCLLRSPMREVLAELSAELVRATLVGGRVVHGPI